MTSTVDITFNRAFRVWWSYAWRGMVLSPVVIVPVQIFVIAWIIPHLRAAGVGETTGRARLRELLELLWFVWPIAVVGAIIIQTIAMRWMLRRARWAEFQLIPWPVGAPPPERAGHP
ncbi:MAG TPA: hypothetical protein VLV25_10715 [Steroidobacteraceae bacterium]|jgi:hypothetical protein|nr:hypothetical protein [Steroidobacteraceae bacterium]